LGRIYLLSKKHIPDRNLSGIFIGTIHSWCHQFLRTKKEYRGFDSLDELQVDALISRLYDQLELEEVYSKPFPKGIEPFLQDLEIYYNENLLLSEIKQPIQNTITKLLNILYENKLLTFGGMINYSSLELNKSGPIKNLAVLYVDEYQDVNNAQVALIRAMITSETKLVVVGDDLQCIYNWRGSDVTRILNFASDFSNGIIKRLSANYRSRPSITYFGNSIAQNIQLRDHQKIMNPLRDNEKASGVYWISSSSNREEVIDTIRIIQEIRERGVPLNNIAILLRSVLGSGQEFRDALIQNGIQVNCPILSRAIEFIFSFLIPLFQWLQKENDEPRNAKEEKELLNESSLLWDSCKTWISELHEETEVILWEEVANWNTLIRNKKNEAYNIRGLLYNLLDKVSIKVDDNNAGLLMGLSIASQIIRGVEEIHRRRLKNQERRTPNGMLSEVIVSLKRNATSFGESQPLDYGNEGVLITTIHKAKGLEWPIVIIPRLKSRKFPVQSPILKSSFPTEINQRYSTTLDDEYRLFYVACTRAKERLFLIDPCFENENSRSAFLKNIDQAHTLSPMRLEKIRSSEFVLQSDIQNNESPLEIGLSNLLIYMTCPYQYALSKVAKIQPSVGDELGYGKGLHEIIQRRIEDGNNWDKPRIKSEVDEGVHLPLMSLDGEINSKKAIVNRISTLQELGIFNQRSTPEVDIEVEIENSIITGKIDGITETETNELIIRDWKSSIHDEFLIRYEKQLQFYAYALNKKGKKVARAELVDISETDKHKSLITREVDISEKRINNLLVEIQEGVKNMLSNNFTPTVSRESCIGCDMQRICNKRQV
jgi:DNA helicase-2/ATP-dependent DNA helicase PcrA